MLLFAITGSGTSVFVIAKSTSVITPVTVLALLFPGFGSLVALEMLLVVVMLELLTAFEFTFTTKLPEAEVPEGKTAAVHVMVPVLPGSRVVQLAPGGA